MPKPAPMTGLYLFAAAVGVPLVVWFLFSGGDDAGDGGDGGGGDDSGIGAVMVRLLPLNTIAIVAATFGITGLALGATGSGSATTFVWAVIAGAVAGVLNSTVFSYIRRSDSTSGASDAQLAGAIGRVVLPVGPGRRGRIAVSAGDQQIYLSAEAASDLGAEGELEVGAPVLIVEVHDGIAGVTRLDPELA